MDHLNWKIPEQYAETSPLLENAGYAPLLSAVLLTRGIETPEAASEYLSIGEELLCDPYLLNDMDRAVARIKLAAARREKTAVYGDYDVDGITASCLMADYLHQLGLDCEIYIPDRIDEGYGLNSEAVAVLHEKGVSLIITVDCGITAVGETETAKALGMDIIITDHHECPGELPDASAVIDPKRRDSTYPNDILAGVGVAFKLACALSGDVPDMLERYSDLVALGTVADVMPLVGENRVIVHRGLEKLKTSPRPGFAALLKESGVSGRPVSSTTVGFSLAPRINAAGRLCKTETSVSLLLTDDESEAHSCAVELCELNRHRQELETKVWTESVEELGDEPPDCPIVLSNENWHPGVVGIAASRLAEEYRLPAIIIYIDGDNGKGSCRSYGSFNLFDALSACSQQLESFGGHAFAAGLSIKRENIEAFRSEMAAYYSEHKPAELPVLEPELLLPDLSLMTMEDVSSLDILEPCGDGNPRPLFCVCGVVLESLAQIGGGKHLRMSIAKRGNKLDCVFFSHCLDTVDVSEGDIVDICFAPQINEFRSQRSVQLLITDVRPSSAPRLCRDIFNGDATLSEAAGLGRDQLAGVWRRLAQEGRNIDIPLSELFGGEIFSVEPIRLCLCLKVFEELGLITVKMSDTVISVHICDNKSKTDLQKSPLFRRLNKK